MKLKPVFFILLAVVFASCSKEAIQPASAKTVSTAAATITAAPADTAAYDIYNGTTGTSVIKVTCDQCTAIATIGNTTTPLIFINGVGELKYTPASGLSVYIAVCPNGIKPVKADILDKTNTSVYSFAGTTGNWNYTYTFK